MAPGAPTIVKDPAKRKTARSPVYSPPQTSVHPETGGLQTASEVPMSRMFLVWSLLFGLALAGADWYIERGRPQVVPSYEGGTPVNAESDDLAQATRAEGGTPMPPK